jgi:glycosyltransferase involved in cell wall biosynthesis
METIVANKAAEAAKAVASSCWQIFTSEYPPQPGGVSDYTYWLAAGLAGQGDEVHVWCPAHVEPGPPTRGVVIHRELGRIAPADLRNVGQELNRFPGPQRILVQWVPHGYGYRTMNVGFCWWLWQRARQGDRVEIMVHEPYIGFRWSSPRQSAVALVHRLMTVLLLRAAQRVWMSIPYWEGIWRPYALGRRIPFTWLPIPSNIPEADKPERVADLRRRYASEGRLLIGHFGTFGSSITDLLEPLLLALTGDAGKPSILLMGMGSEQFREALIRKQPQLAGLLQATGKLAAEDLSCHVSACDLLIQPYPDGVSTRRTSVMLGLSHGKPIVSNTGQLSESFWSETGALALAPAGNAEAFLRLLRGLETDAGERARMSQAARTLYQERFAMPHVIQAMREAAAFEALGCAS